MMSRLSLIFRRQVVYVVGVAIIFAMSLANRVEAVPSNSLEIFNDDWSITLTDYGYSDLLFDQRTDFEGREYLSGEWGAAVMYTVGGEIPTPVAPEWIEPEFIFPDWTTNSNFAVDSAIAATVGVNASGFTIYESTVSNAHLEIKQTYEFVDTTIDAGAGVGNVTGPGVKMGDVPASSVGPPDSTTSDRYVLKQTYEIKNKTVEAITGLNLFQFLHGLNSQDALYDDRIYGPSPFGDYHYDTTLAGESFFGGSLHDDTITFHSKVEPSAWEVGYYGDEDFDGHEDLDGKPSVGVHLSIEGDSLSNTDWFDPGELWVSGAQKFGLGTLGTNVGVDDSVTFDVLLSIETFSEPIPEPATMTLLGIGLAGLGGRYLKRRRKQRADA